ncbi:hypothetical protein [Thermodesulfitimonas autotrophica]|uniref:hypothetical protein n=1 Tax=Thermodesulfitimonas autotrophica TaxID=1894989 RepID=UPI002FE0E894
MKQVAMDAFTKGLILGLLIGEGHFGGDGRQPHVTLRMHARHEKLFTWLVAAVPGSRLYGPYNHGGRVYYQWMVRGAPLKELLARLDPGILATLDPPTYERLQKMKRDYGLD